jgi:hypothetical protein|tara:strand:- start:1740 stop:1946 length:207 start_codon:yes stop_codon:yes gene_type:complete
MKSIEFTQNEISVTIQLLDIAVKAGGLNVAEAASVIFKKLGVHVEQEPTDESEEPSVFADSVEEVEAN